MALDDFNINENLLLVFDKACNLMDNAIGSTIEESLIDSVNLPSEVHINLEATANHGDCLKCDDGDE